MSGNTNQTYMVTYQYDALHRLTEEVNYGLNLKYNFTYGLNNEIINKVITSITTGTITTINYEYSSSDIDQLSKYNNHEVTYDDLGRITSYYKENKKHCISYYKKGLIGSVNIYNGTTLEKEVIYTYDCLNRLRTKEVIKDTSYDMLYDYYYDNNLLVREKCTNKLGTEGNYNLDYVYGEQGIIGLKISDDEIYLVRQNIFGDISEIYHNGNLASSFTYSAYGEVKQENRNAYCIGNYCSIGYRGYYYDRETGWFWLSSRYYSPELCRFISPDDVDYLEPESINGLNLYAYAKNNPIMYYDPSGHSAILIGLIIGAVIGFGTAAYIDYQDDGQIFNCSVKWYDYLGATVLGGAIGAGLGAFAGMSFSATLPTGFALAQTSAGTMALVATGSMTLTVTGAQILGVAGLLSATYMFASNNRPGNNRVQNKQFEQAARSAGYNPKDPKVRDILNEIHQYIRKNKLNLGWKELLELIKEWLG